MLRRLLILILLTWVGWIFGRQLRRRRGAETGRVRQTTGAGDGTLVRDRVCNKFLPRSRALIAEVGGETHFFCSDGCRSQFLSGS